MKLVVGFVAATILVVASDPCLAQALQGTVESWAMTAVTIFVRCCQLIVGGSAGYKAYEIISHGSHNFVAALVPLGVAAVLVLLVPPMFGVNAIPGFGGTIPL